MPSEWFFNVTLLLPVTPGFGMEHRLRCISHYISHYHRQMDRSDDLNLNGQPNDDDDDGVIFFSLQISILNIGREIQKEKKSCEKFSPHKKIRYGSKTKKEIIWEMEIQSKSI